MCVLCCWTYLQPARLSWAKFCSLGRVLGEFLLQHIFLLLYKGHSLRSIIYFLNPNGPNLKTRVLSLQFKFKVDPTVNKSDIMDLPKQVFGQSHNQTISTHINQTPQHNLISTPSSCTRIIHTILQIIQINQVIK